MGSIQSLPRAFNGRLCASNELSKSHLVHSVVCQQTHRENSPALRRRSIYRRRGSVNHGEAFCRQPGQGGLCPSQRLYYRGTQRTTAEQLSSVMFKAGKLCLSRDDQLIDVAEPVFEMRIVSHACLIARPRWRAILPSRPLPTPIAVLAPPCSACPKADRPGSRCSETEGREWGDAWRGENVGYRGGKWRGASAAASSRSRRKHAWSDVLPVNRGKSGSDMIVASAA